MDEHEKKRRLVEDPDFICLKRFGYSVKAALVRYPDGLPTPLIAQALDMSERAVEKRFEDIVGKLREVLAS